MTEHESEVGNNEHPACLPILVHTDQPLMIQMLLQKLSDFKANLTK